MQSKVVLLSLLLSVLLAPALSRAHCDTLAGPVIADARSALEQADVTPVLKWIKPEYESEVRATFEKTMAVRSLTSEARSLADQHFFETVVRLHRAGEGAPFTGLKDDPPEPFLVQADKALSSGSGNDLVREITAEVAAALHHRFAAAAEARRHAADSVSAGREYVSRYVELMHFLERLHGGEMTDSPPAHQH